ncbi:anaerobic ribonucleoside-triphosphate reductase [Novispirillum itersonii]|uniref:anaerobic ribonucleoside-triphosphate reductase n=1 Tax=Novispirillum itersonii TaxID=189 RepID=UPI0028937C03|nr:anaerobic ribonucleoside-triphosphate reductase [Novispirillum itersonii]
MVNYWLFHVYPPEVGQAHRDGDIHIHDLDMLAGSSRFSSPSRNWSTTSTSRRAGAPRRRSPT